MATLQRAGDTKRRSAPIALRASPRRPKLSLTPYGGKPNGQTKPFDISADGAWVVVVSEASNLVPDDTNGVADVFIAAVDNR